MKLTSLQIDKMKLLNPKGPHGLEFVVEGISFSGHLEQLNFQEDLENKKFPKPLEIELTNVSFNLVADVLVKSEIQSKSNHSSLSFLCVWKALEFYKL